MARSSATGSMAGSNVTLTYPATTAYKQWVWRELRRRKWTLQRLVDEMKEHAREDLLAISTPHGKTMHETISTATVSMMLGAGPNDAGEFELAAPPSNCSWMPALNKALGLAPPPVCDPDDELTQLIDRFRARWARASSNERKMVIAAIGVLGDRR